MPRVAGGFLNRSAYGLWRQMRLPKRGGQDFRANSHRQAAIRPSEVWENPSEERVGAGSARTIAR